MIELTFQSIDPCCVLQSVTSPLAGATVLFLGTTRAVTGQQHTARLEYECYAEMARAKLAELELEARRRWPLEGCTLVHRLGIVGVGEASVAVAVSTAHRAAAFEAGQWLIDAIKEIVPIWKQEHWVGGGSQWIHPGTEPIPLTEPAARTLSSDCPPKSHPTK